MPKLRLLIADDHEIVRKGLRDLAERQTGWTIVAEAVDGREAVKRARETRPDVAVVDIAMPGLNGLEASRQIVKLAPMTKVLILTMHESDVLIREVFNVGARGYLLKTDAGSDLVNAVEALGRDLTFLTPRVAKMVLDGYLQASKGQKNLDSFTTRLTARQREIVQLLAEGKSNKEVAATLCLSVKTTETHRANIMRRLNCHSIPELVRYAVRNHLVQA
jgi:DNA-binding NarL/FixJ family response regulator